MGKKSGAISRRAFFRKSSKGAVAVLGATSGVALLRSTAKASSWMLPDTSPETPSSHEIATMKAMADTFLPNWDGDPGALECDAFTTINDPHYGVNPYISEVSADLNDWCSAAHWPPWDDFVDSNHQERIDSLEERMGYWGSTIQSWYLDAYEGILSLTKLAYFGGLHNSVGTNYAAFPGESTGYHPTSAAGAYHSDDTPKSIPDNYAAGVSSWVYVSGSGTVSELKVSVNITHTWEGDLVIKLYAPNGTYYTLWNRQGGSADDVILHDVNVTAHNGKTAQGWWKLNVSDHAGQDTGTLNFWSFKLRTNLDDQA